MRLRLTPAESHILFGLWGHRGRWVFQRKVYEAAKAQSRRQIVSYLRAKMRDAGVPWIIDSDRTRYRLLQIVQPAGGD